MTAKKFFISGITADLTDADVEDHFKAKKLYLKFSSQRDEKGRSYGYGYATSDEPCDAKAVTEDCEIKGVRVKIEPVGLKKDSDIANTGTTTDSGTLGALESQSTRLDLHASEATNMERQATSQIQRKRVRQESPPRATVSSEDLSHDTRVSRSSIPKSEQRSQTQQHYGQYSLGAPSYIQPPPHLQYSYPQNSIPHSPLQQANDMFVCVPAALAFVHPLLLSDPRVMAACLNPNELGKLCVIDKSIIDSHRRF